MLHGRLRRPSAHRHHLSLSTENEHARLSAPLRLSLHASDRFEVTQLSAAPGCKDGNGHPACRGCGRHQRRRRGDAPTKDAFSRDWECFDIFTWYVLHSHAYFPMARIKQAVSTMVFASMLTRTSTDVQKSHPSTSSASVYNHKKHHRKHRHTHHADSMAPRSRSFATCHPTWEYQLAVEKCSG